MGSLPLRNSLNMALLAPVLYLAIAKEKEGEPKATTLALAY